MNIDVLMSISDREGKKHAVCLTPNGKKVEFDFEDMITVDEKRALLLRGVETEKRGRLRIPHLVQLTDEQRGDYCTRFPTPIDLNTTRQTPITDGNRGIVTFERSLIQELITRKSA